MQSCACTVSDVISCIADATQVCSFCSLSPLFLFLFFNQNTGFGGLVSRIINMKSHTYHMIK